MQLSEININKLSREQITKILYGEEKDNGEKGDCIFVYGGRGIERVHKAVELFNFKRAEHILFSGGSGYGKYTYPLSWTMRDNALKFKIPEDKILVFTWCPADYKEHQFDNWWQYPESHEYVMKEITNLIKYIREGQLVDIEIEI
jgi:hypothetical protein